MLSLLQEKMISCTHVIYNYIITQKNSNNEKKLIAVMMMISSLIIIKIHSNNTDDTLLSSHTPDRHHCPKSGSIPKTESGLILLHLCDSLMTSMKFD